ncbi:type II toxin-antitoxin system PemK/MazF family toxin [Aurantimicrobium photophilum]|uniref:PemK-like protein n=1 Tax=Aurantimicrobium photophilum TaxID=1987356 RepID=A0A2Z3RW16_9MICO|nr:type II toxin-antitoxin system PemK/MazF family toxin [Aurantimicrobium photophilum]AWR21025.1 PemK-like protein [Aurantimicrobium photophilum]
MKPGDIYLVWFPFSNEELSSFKKRPIVVLSEHKSFNPHDESALVAMVTGSESRVNNPASGDVLVEDWQNCGLVKTSVIRTSRLWTLETRDIDKKLGNLKPTQLSEIQSKILTTFPELKKCC